MKLTLSRLNKFILTSVISLLVYISPANAAFSDLEFGKGQLGDAQWNYSGCTNASSTNCQIYSKNLTRMYPNYSSGLPTGYYVKFSYNDSTSKWTASVYDSNGTLKSSRNGDIVAAGTYTYAGVTKKYFMYMDTSNYGTVFSIDGDFNNGNGFTFTKVYHYADEDDMDNYGPASSTPSYSSAPTGAQTNLRTSTRGITHSGNGIYIQQSGDNLDLDVQQHGDDNLVAGTSTTSQTISDATISGDYNTVNVTQGSATNASDDNVLLFGINGDHNSLTVSQGDYSGDTGGHRAIIDITGGYNTIGLTQYNIGFGSGQFADINVNGNSNTVSSTQRETDKMLFVDVNGNSNSITTDQKDSGNHFLDITVTNNQTVNATQQGTGDHAATIDLSGYSSTLQLNQNSSTDQVYSIQQNCLTVSGCGTTTVNQQ